MLSPSLLVLGVAGVGVVVVVLVVLVPLVRLLAAHVQWRGLTRAYGWVWEAALNPRHPSAALHVQRRRAWLAQVEVGLPAVAAQARTCCEVHRLVAAHHDALVFADIASVRVCVERRASMEALVIVLRRRFAHAELAIDPACAHNQAVMDLMHGLCGARCHFVQGDLAFGPPICTPAWLARDHLPAEQRNEMEARMTAHDATTGGTPYGF